MIGQKQRAFGLVGVVVLVLCLVASLLGVGYAMRSVSEKSLSSDMAVVAANLASEKMESLLAKKAYRGYQSIEPVKSEVVYNDRWIFISQIDVAYLSPDNLEQVRLDQGLKLVKVRVAWGSSAGNSVLLETILSDQKPKNVKGIVPHRCEL